MRTARSQHLDLFRELVISQIQSRDQSTAFGILWSFLHPILLLAVLYVFFSRVFGQDIPHYGVYLLLGLVHYTHFANTTGAALRSLGQMRELTAETVFPKELLVLSNIVAGSVEFAVSIAVCLVIAGITGVPLSWSWAWVAVVCALQMVLVAWVSLLLAGLYPFLTDIDHVYQIFLRVMFFVTPVFYDPAVLGVEAAHLIIAVNPLAALIEYSRRSVIGGGAPAVMAIFLVVNLLIAWATLKLFRYLEPRFAENV